MKTTYTVPALMNNGSVVLQRLNVAPAGPEGPRLSLGAGRLGYDL